MSDISKINVDGVDYDVKDTTARTEVTPIERGGTGANNKTDAQNNLSIFSNIAVPIKDMDLNDCVNVGMYTYSIAQSNTITNTPKSAQTTLFVLPRVTNGDTTNLIQIAITHDYEIYIRHNMSGTWIDWSKVSLPMVNTSDNGKVLKVVNGVWTAVAE